MGASPSPASPSWEAAQAVRGRNSEPHRWGETWCCPVRGIMPGALLESSCKSSQRPVETGTTALLYRRMTEACAAHVASRPGDTACAWWRQGLA